MRLAAAGTVALALGLARPAAASSGQMLASNTVVVVTDPGTTLGVPADGRLRGYEFSATVLGVATGPTLEQTGGPIKAATGQKLWVFGLRWTDSNQPGGPPNPVAPTLVVDGTRISIPLPDRYGDNGFGQATFDTGPMYWVASLPALAKDVAVELASGGLAQDFSLTHMSREGTQPAVLYRDSTSWQVTQPLALEHDIPTPDPGDPNFHPFLPVDVDSLTLTWFGPDSTSDVPADLSQAWLVPGLSSLTTTNDHNDPNVCFPPLPPADITLTLPGAQPIAATKFPGLGPDRNGYGAFVDGYGFKVPASVTTAVLTVNPGTIQVGFEGCGYSANVTTDSPAVFNLTLPAPVTPTPPAGAVSAPPLIHNLPATRAPSTASSREPGPFTGADLALLIVALILVAAVTPPLLLRRKRRRASKHSGVTVADPAASHTDRPSGPPVAAFDGRVPSTESASNGSQPATASAPVPRTAEPALLDLPGSPPPLADGVVEVQFLGKERMAGWPAGKQEPGPTLVELVAYLVLYPQDPPSGEQLRDLVCAGRDRDLDATSVRRYLGEARRVLGSDRVPEARGGRGYSIVGITSDWHRFSDLVSAAETAGTAKESARLYADALALVRGTPFSQHPTGTHAWAETGDNIAQTISNSVLSAALALARIGFDAGDHALVAWAVAQGVKVCPTEDSLHEIALDAAARRGLARVKAAWSQVVNDHRGFNATPSPALYDHYMALVERLERQQPTGRERKPPS